MKKILSMTVIALTTAIALSVPAHAVTDTAIERLCYVKAEDAPVAYNSEAQRYGVSRHTLRKLEKTVTCSNGVKLGEVENQWVKRNPR